MAFPWDDKLAGTFEDEATRSAVSQFLASEIQPYITRLEQERPPAEAAQLWADFQSDPLATFKSITEELIEHDMLTPEKIGELFEVEGSNEPPPAGEPAAVTPEQARAVAEALGLDPEAVKAASELTLNRAAEEDYDERVAKLVEQHPEYFKHPKDPDKDVRSWLDAHVITAEDETNPERRFQQAFESYKGWYEDAFGDPTATPAGDPPPNPLTEGAAETSTAKEYTNFDDAVEDFFAEQRAASEPPAVGSV